MVSAQVSEDASEILIQFDIETNQAGMALNTLKDCSQVLDLPPNQLLCEWLTARSLRAPLTSISTIAVESPIVPKPHTILSASGRSMYASTSTVLQV